MSCKSSADTSDIHVITENGEQCFMWRSSQLTYIAQDRQELPLVLATKFGQLATKLDLSYNTLNSFRNINLFTNISELILDNNCFEDGQLEFKQNLRLKTLSLNKNKLSDLSKLINSIKNCFPNLEYLSLIGNPLCPSLSDIHTVLQPPDDGRRMHMVNLTSGESMIANFALSPHPPLAMGDEQGIQFANQKYRHFIIYHLPNLRFLDSSPISGQERDEALRRCYWMEAANTTNSTNNNSISRQNNNDTNSHSEANSVNGQQRYGRNDGQLHLLTIMSDFDDHQCHATERSASSGYESSQPKGAFSRLSYKYTGKNSEGNRFIRNNDL